MRKLSLDLGALRVQSFAPDENGPAPWGTVHGRQGRPTGEQDTDCSAVDACPSARGCSEIDACRPTQGSHCPSAALECPSSRECTHRPGCEDPSAVDACPSARGCTEIGCAQKAGHR